MYSMVTSKSLLLLSRQVVSYSATPWIVACQPPLSMEFSLQGYWIQLPCPSPGDLPETGIKPSSPASTGRFFTAEPPENPIVNNTVLYM